MLNEIYKVEPNLIGDIEYLKLEDVEKRDFTFVIHFLYMTKFGDINKSEISFFKFMEHYKKGEISVEPSADMQRILLRNYEE